MDDADHARQDRVAAVRKLAFEGEFHQFFGWWAHVVKALPEGTTVEQGFSILDLGGVVYTIGILPPGTIIEITGSPDLLSLQRGVQGVYMGKTNPQ